MRKTDISSMTLSEIESLLISMNQAKYRADQIFDWLHRRNARAFSEMVNLPQALRKELEALFYIPSVTVINELSSQDNNTKKFLLKISDAYAESVLMSYKHGNSVCISTQAGCKMGCAFCASASGFHRNLTAGEYCAQVYNVMPVKNIVLMGCGEPLDNFDSTLRFIELITHPKGMNISQRHITLSSCGLVPQIYALAELNLQITLAISLHAPTDEIRKAIMPVAKKYPLDELISACRRYTEKTRRRITFEYAMIKGLNDSISAAKALSKLLKGMLCHVNLIPINKAGRDFSPTPPREIEKFAAALNVPVTLRRSLGADINAACGQLRGVLKN